MNIPMWLSACSSLFVNEIQWLLKIIRKLYLFEDHVSLSKPDNNKKKRNNGRGKKTWWEILCNNLCCVNHNWKCVLKTKRLQNDKINQKKTTTTYI